MITKPRSKSKLTGVTKSKRNTKIKSTITNTRLKPRLSQFYTGWSSVTTQVKNNY